MTLSIVVAAAAEEGAQGGLGGPFVLEPGLIVWTWVVFILLFLLLKGQRPVLHNAPMPGPLPRRGSS